MFLFFKRDKLAIIRLFAFIAFMLAMFMSWNVWFSDRAFPMIPYFEGLPVPNYFMDVLLISSFSILFLFFVIQPKWTIGLPIILIYSYWVLLDQNRIQHYFFELIFAVFALSVFKNDDKTVKKCLLLIFIGTYFWSGIHKYNDLFFEKWLNGLNKRIPFVPYWMRVSFTYAVPFLEALFGIFLVFIKTRKLGIWLIAIMHLIILATFLKDGFGYVVIPLMAFNVFTLFYVFYNSTLSFQQLFTITVPKVGLMFLIVIIFPLGNLFGVYDHLLAFSYFSGKPKYCRIHFENKKVIEQLPKGVLKNVREFQGSYYIDLNEWAARSIGVLVYPEIRVYEKVQKHVNNQLETSNTTLSFY